MPFSRFNLRQLEAFAAVAELHSFSAASDRLALTAQAVSRLVAELESVLGFKLFERTTRSVRLSGAGREFLASAETTLRHVRLTEKTADDVLNRASGVLRIAAPQVLASMVLPEAIKAFIDQKPKVVIRIVDAKVEELVDTVVDGDVDLAIGPDRPAVQGLTRHPLFDSSWVLWCRPEHPLASKKKVTWADLREHPLVAAGNDHERSVAQMRINLPEGVRVSPVDVVDNITTAMGIAANGLAATLAPAYVGIMANKLGLVMRRVLEPETVRQVCLYLNDRTSTPRVTESFSEFLVQWMPLWHAEQEKLNRPKNRSRLQKR
ncbi:MAG: LysR family transcriptional regulator [Burkholderiaceae bacterium]